MEPGFLLVFLAMPGVRKEVVRQTDSNVQAGLGAENFGREETRSFTRNLRAKELARVLSLYSLSYSFTKMQQLFTKWMPLQGSLLQQCVLKGATLTQLQHPSVRGPEHFPLALTAGGSSGKNTWQIP